MNTTCKLQILIASSYADFISAVRINLHSVPSLTYIFELSVVETVDELIVELERDVYHFIISEYSFDGIDIWELVKLIHSDPMSAHSIPLILIKDTCEMDIPMILADEMGLKVVCYKDLRKSIQTTYEDNTLKGYVRGITQPSIAKVLIIEDDPDAALIMQHSLQPSFQVEIAYTGEDGLELWSKTHHDLILLDYMLPGIKGDQVLAKLMDIDMNQPVIMMTAYNQPDTNKSMILNGASDYLCKPFDVTHLAAKCQLLINRSKLIYQAYYMDSKNRILKKFIWQLERALNSNDLENTMEIVRMIKTAFAINFTEDEHLLFLRSEV